jgi:hypothetical protein
MCDLTSVMIDPRVSASSAVLLRSKRSERNSENARKAAKNEVDEAVETKPPSVKLIWIVLLGGLAAWRDRHFAYRTEFRAG